MLHRLRRAVGAARGREALRAAELRERQRAVWTQFFQQYDVVLAPVMPTAAFPHDTEGPMPERLLDIDGAAVPHPVAAAWCLAIASALLPVVTLPTGLNRAGLRIAEILDAAVGSGFIPPPTS